MSKNGFRQLHLGVQSHPESQSHLGFLQLQFIVLLYIIFSRVLFFLLLLPYTALVIPVIAMTN